MSFLIEFIILLFIGLIFIYKWATKNDNFFKEKNIPHESKYLLIKEMAINRKTMLDVLIQADKNQNSKVYGIFEIRNPLTVIKDPELIKQVTVKDFDHFINHRTVMEPEDEILFGNSLFSLKDQKWREMRATLTPAFTGSKMRQMFELINECCNDAIKHLKEQLINEPNGIELEIKDFFTRFTNDVIASTAFGLKINSLTDKHNDFYERGKKLTNFSSWQIMKVFLLSNCKPVMRFFKTKLFEEEFTNYFMRLVLDAIKYRSENNISRPDMINMLMEAQKATNNKWSEVDIVAQCFLFFVAGFESTATLICFTAHEIMEHRDVQEKLLSEIDEINEKLNGKPLTYEHLNDMKYMEMIISETMRKWPAALATDRVCAKPYSLKYDDNVVNFNVGDVIWINIAGLHYDEENYPNPTKFDPERFSDENKNNIKPYTYLPFGLGPRNCIGNRFALMEVKAILFSILTNFTFELSKKSTIPLELTPSTFQLKAKNGFWLKFCPRNESFY